LPLRELEVTLIPAPNATFPFTNPNTKNIAVVATINTKIVCKNFIYYDISRDNSNLLIFSQQITVDNSPKKP
jgi:hypothetical protein